MNQRCACGQEIDPTEFPPLICPTCGAPLDSATEPMPLPPVDPDRLLPTPKKVMICAVAVIAALFVCWALVTTVMIPSIQRLLNAHELRVCRDNLLKINETLTCYRGDTHGDTPSLPGVPGRLMFAESVVMEYLPHYGSSSAFCCPSQQLPSGIRKKELIDDQSYFYLPYVVLNDIQGKYYAEVLYDLMINRLEIPRELEVPNGRGSNGEDRILRVRRFVARQFVEVYDIMDHQMIEGIHNAVNARIPIIVEWPSHHPEPGGHVLYLDGHVEFLKYPGPFPMTRHFIEAMRQLDQLSPEIETNQ